MRTIALLLGNSSTISRVPADLSGAGSTDTNPSFMFAREIDLDTPADPPLRRKTSISDLVDDDRGRFNDRRVSLH